MKDIKKLLAIFYTFVILWGISVVVLIADTVIVVIGNHKAFCPLFGITMLCMWVLLVCVQIVNIKIQDKANGI